MNSLAQGEVWLADLPQPLGRRPVLVLTRTKALPHLKNVTIATISSPIRGIDTEVELGLSDGVRRRCAVSLDNLLTALRSISISILLRWMPFE